MPNKNEKKPFPVIETARLVLREIVPADAPALFRNFSDEEVTRWFQDQPLRDLREAEELVQYFDERFRQGAALYWGIGLKGQSDLIGTCGYVEYEREGSGEIGYDLIKAMWGQGLMREALEPVIAYGFGQLGLRTVWANTYRTNARSIGLLDRLGFTLVRVENDSGIHVLERAAWEASRQK
jgi:ribosomal-protein-alanine N-acetyltransferase